MTESLYIHIPFCVSKCSYCDFFSVAGKEKHFIDSYADSLSNEISFRIKSLGVSCLSSVYIGGGTPSILSEMQIEKICSAFSSFVASGSEITIEANPDDITEEKLLCFSDNGINRLSLGIQAFSDEVLKKVRRRSDSEKNIKALSLVSEKWKGVFSVDMISALPFQSEKNFIKGLETVLDFSPHHISLYSLTFEDNTPLSRSLENSEFDYDFEKADLMWLKGKDFLEKNGFEQYEVSNFFRKDGGRKCAHNLRYWNLENYAAAGSGGTGSVYIGKNEKPEDSESLWNPEKYENAENLKPLENYGRCKKNLSLNEKSYRYTNTKNIVEYINFWGNAERKLSDFKGHENLEEIERLSEETLFFEYFMMGLRKTEGVSLGGFKRRFSRDIPSKTKSAMEKWIKKGLAETKKADGDEFFFLNRNGLLFLNSFLEEII